MYTAAYSQSRNKVWGNSKDNRFDFGFSRTQQQYVHNPVPNRLVPTQTTMPTFWKFFHRTLPCCKEHVLRHRASETSVPIGDDNIWPPLVSSHLVWSCPREWHRLLESCQNCRETVYIPRPKKSDDYNTSWCVFLPAGMFQHLQWPCECSLSVFRKKRGLMLRELVCECWQWMWRQMWYL